METDLKGTTTYNISDAKAITFSHALTSFKKLNRLNFKTIYLPITASLLVGKILQYIYQIFHRKHAPFLTPYIVEQISSSHILDISKAIQDFGYQPVRNFDKDFIL